MEDSKLREIALRAVNSMLVGPKPNPTIPAARKKFGKMVDEILAKKSFKLTDFSKEEQKIIKKLIDLKYALVYEKNDIYYPRPLAGENIRIAHFDQPECKKLAKFVREECWKRGCTVQMVAFSDADQRIALEITPDWALAGPNKFSEAIFKETDARFFVGYEEDPLYSKGLEDKKKLSAPVAQFLHEIGDKKKTRWCLLGWPTLLKPECIPTPIEKYNKVFIDSIYHTFTKEVEDNVDYYAKALTGGDKVHITANDGTDLTFSIKGRPVLESPGYLVKEDIVKGDVGLNIPDGEVFIAPIENSANGKICFDSAMPHGAGLIKNLWLTFKKGKVVEYSADGNGAELFKKYLDSNSGEKDRIAELGIGCNPKAEFICSALIDEKIFGTVHIAIGNNTGAYHGKNKASNHDDFIKQMRGKQGNVSVDGKLIMKDGNPIK